MSQFKISLSEKQVALNQKTTSKKVAIDFVGTLLLKNNFIEKEYIKTMHQRDQDVNVYIGNRVAIPHGTSDSLGFIKKSGIVIATYKKPLNWNGNDCNIVIGIATKGSDHMEVISQIGVTLSEAKNIKKIINAKSAKEIERIFND